LEATESVVSAVWRTLRRCLPVASRLRWRVALLDCCGSDASGAADLDGLLRSPSASDLAWRRPIVSVLYVHVRHNALVFPNQAAERQVMTLTSSTALLALPWAAGGGFLTGTCVHVASFEDVSLLIFCMLSWRAATAGAASDAEWSSGATRVLAQELVLMVATGGGLPPHVAAAMDFASID
jgi:hypothetical protein